jgi:hypothetical protein
VRDVLAVADPALQRLLLGVLEQLGHTARA